MNSTRGTTLLEIATVLTVVGTLLAVALPPIGRLADQWAVQLARDEVVALVHRARIEARIRGGSRLRLLPDSVIELRAGDEVRARWRGSDHGVALTGLGEEPVELRWDALGVGVVASRSFALRRGRAEAALVLSTTGRVRRR